MGALFAYDSPLWRMADKILRFLWLSILWLICCIPVFTIGASTTALYTVTLKYVKNNEGYMTTSFFKAFRENFKQGTIIWAVLTCIGIIMGIGLIFYFQQKTAGIFYMIMTTAFFSLFVSFLLVNLFVYPLLAAFDNTVSRTILNALIIALTHLASGILILVSSVIVMIVGTMVFPPLLIAAPAMTAYFNCRFFVKIFDQYLNQAADCKEVVL